MPFKRSNLTDALPATNEMAVPDRRYSPPPEAPSVRDLVAQLRSANPAVRSTAVARLQEAPDALASVAPALLREDDPSVRIMTLTALASTTHPDLESWVIRVLDEDPDVNVCAAAVDLLGEIGTSAARPSLDALPTRFAGQPYIRFAVRVALERLTDG